MYDRRAILQNSYSDFDSDGADLGAGDAVEEEAEEVQDDDGDFLEGWPDDTEVLTFRMRFSIKNELPHAGRVLRVIRNSSCCTCA